MSIPAGTSNNAIIFADTFTTNTAIQVRARTASALGDWGAESAIHSISLFTAPPLAPTDLTPTEPQNRTRDIQLSWRHAPSESDRQVDSEVAYRQGSTGAWTIVSGGTTNRVVIPAGEFATNTSIQWQVRTAGEANGWGAWSAIATIGLMIQPPLAPTSLVPTGDTQNRRVSINLSWRHTPNPSDWDSQSDSIVEFWQDTNQRTVVRAGAGNRLELPSDTFADNRNVHWRVRTVTLRNGEGAWSAVSSFPLDSFASRPPIELVPTMVMNPRVPINLTWQFVPNERWFPNDGQIDSEAEVWQGTGTRHTFRGYIDNRAIIPANTFTTLTTPINFRARTRTNLGGWGEFSPAVLIPLAISPPLAAIDLLPTAPQNPRGVIRVTFTHVPNSEMPQDEQVGSEVQVRQGTGAWRTFAGSAENVVYLPAFTFTAYTQVEFQARTITAINGAGEWSISERFDLRMTPPLPPELMFPVNIAVLPDNIFLQWSYNSPFDTFPSRFDIRHRIGNGAWVDNRTDSAGGLPATSNLTISVANVQSRMEWQVRAWGELGDVGEWSNIGLAFIMGIPATPVIVQVSNSGRPEITFSSVNAMAWEIEILQGNNLIYSTGERAFDGVFRHVTGQFVPNGSYTARIRIINEYGLYSVWASRNFTISVVPPEAVQLRTANNLLYNTRLWFDGIGRNVYVYRAEFENDNFVNIAHVNNENNWEDWTVRPRQRYKYFIRVVGENFAFADSGIQSAVAEFKDTTIALAEKPQEMVKLLYQLGGKPTKDSEFEKEKNLTHFAGREKPVLQVGEHTDRMVSLAFHATLEERDRLESLSKSGDILILRDWRLGVMYGTITGGLRAQASDIAGFCNVSFSFTEADYLLGVSRETS